MRRFFFYASRSDRRAFRCLILLLCLAMGGVWLIHCSDEEESRPSEEQASIERFLVQLEQKEEPRRQQRFPNRPQRPRRQPPVLAAFDPNEADSAELVRLGLPPFMARNILRYREKGGRFRTPESFAKVYGLSTEQFETLKPYIRIGESYRPTPPDTTLQAAWRARTDSLRALKYPEGTVLDLNEADTTELKKIPGIGSAYARAIAVYRERLGGFYSPEQLHELPFLPTGTAGWFRVTQTEHPTIRINRWGVERLKNHPYLNFYQAKVIVEHRKKYGQIKSLSQLTLYKEFTEKDFTRLSHYISFN